MHGRCEFDAILLDKLSVYLCLRLYGYSQTFQLIGEQYDVIVICWWVGG